MKAFNSIFYNETISNNRRVLHTRVLAYHIENSKHEKKSIMDKLRKLKGVGSQKLSKNWIFLLV